MRILAIVILVLLTARIHAQQDNYYTLFWNKKSLFNPASSGVKQRYYGALIGRQQWVGIKDAPKSGMAIFDAKSNLLHGGAGVNFMYEKVGAIKIYSTSINYNYQISFRNNNMLSIGASGGYMIEKIDISQIAVDPIEFSNENLKAFDFKFGLYYASKHLDLGLSSTHYKMPDELSANSEILSHYWFFCSYWFPLFERIVIQPNILLKMVDTDLNHTKLYSGLLVTFNQKMWTGLSYSTNGNIGAMIGCDIIKKFRIGYSFDYIKSEFTNNIYGTHEIILAVII